MPHSLAEQTSGPRIADVLDAVCTVYAGDKVPGDTLAIGKQEMAA